MLPTVLASKISTVPEELRWLVDDLWLANGVGVIGGEPKSCKSFMALDIAVSVASGQSCLRHYTVKTKGRVLLYAAEDALSVVRSRLDGICLAAGLALTDLDIQVITVPVLRIDDPASQDHLRATIDALRPTLLILDPFIRLHRKNENDSGEMAPLLAFLRELNRAFEMAIILVHHSRKRAGNERGGQALRGSSEIHAWLDSSIYLRRMKDNAIKMDVEHRSARSIPGNTITLAQDGKKLALEIMTVEKKMCEPDLSPKDAVLQALSESPASLNTIRSRCKLRKSVVSTILKELEDIGSVKRTSLGFEVVPDSVP